MNQTLNLKATLTTTLGLVASLMINVAMAHGNVTPQPMDTKELPSLGQEWKAVNPYRDPNGEYWKKALQLGASGYNQNCARCHGLGAVAGGMAPDLRLLEADEAGDEWFVNRFRNGFIQNGVTKMPPFENILNQEAAWAIRTYVETRPKDGALEQHTARLKAILEELKGKAQAAKSEGDVKKQSDYVTALKKELSTMNATVKTASGAPVADSVLSNVIEALDGSAASFTKATEALMIGLSAAK